MKAILFSHFILLGYFILLRRRYQEKTSLICGTKYVFTAVMINFFHLVGLFKNRLLKRKVEPNRKKVIGSVKICVFRSFLIFNS